jgi:hypothetical protein
MTERKLIPFEHEIFFGNGSHSMRQQRELIRQVRDLCGIISGLQQPPSPVSTKQELASWKEINRQLVVKRRQLNKSIRKALGL